MGTVLENLAKKYKMLAICKTFVWERRAEYDLERSEAERSNHPLHWKQFT